MPNTEQTVYQVRVIDATGRHRIIHSYETESQAKAAIVMMKKTRPGRYTYSPVKNQPDKYWGVNHPQQ